MKRLAFLPSFVFAAGSAVILYVSMLNVTVFIPPQDVILPTLFAICICVILSLLAFVMTREAVSAGVVSALFILGLLYLWPMFLGILAVTLFALILMRIVLKKVRFKEALLALTIVSVMVSGFYTYRFAAFVAGLPRNLASNPMTAVVTSQDVTAAPDRFPDIYYIVLDGYGRADMLQTIHGFDNSAFVDALEQRGFIVAGESRSNYPRTLLSLSSSLNMQYLTGFTAEMGDSSLWWPAQNAVQHSQVRSFLEGEGYRTVFIASGFDLTDIRDGDAYLKPYPIMLRNFESAFVSWTNLRPLGQVDGLGVSFPSNDEDRRIISYSFETLPAAAALPGPKFVFAHILAPHPPYVFNSQGGPVDHEIPNPGFGSPGFSRNFAEYRQAYLDQLTFINQKALQMIDGILAASATPPVIILQGDHGPDIFFNYDDPGQACLYERYSILNAYYLPGAGPDAVPADITPVDSFRLVFNRYFGTDVPLLPGRSYYSPNLGLYQFQDVTEAASSPCDLPAEFRP